MTSPNFDLVAGASLLHELEHLVEAGISPLEVIKIATTNGVQVIGIKKDVGAIEPGKQVDMIILSDNPIDSNTKKIETGVGSYSMEIIESLAWVTLGFLPMLGSMELAWRLQKRFAKPDLKAIGESSFVKVNRQLAELLPSSRYDRVWIRGV